MLISKNLPLLASCRVVFITPNPFYWDMALTTHFIRIISKTLGRTWGQFFVYYASSEVADKLRDNQTNRTHIMTPWDFTYWYNKHSTTYIVLNIYINSIVVLTVVLTPQSITTTTINSTLSSYSVFLFHLLQYNSHHFLSIFLIFKIIKTSFYPLIYSLSYFIISYNLELSNLLLHIHQNFERIFLRIEKR